MRVLNRISIELNAWGLPRPLPLPPPGGPSTELRGFLMVSSTDRMRQAASEAAVRALMRTMDGSHTQEAKLSAMSSLLMSTPYHIPPCRETREMKCTLETEGHKSA
ncbi:hypothetical protein INR49_011708 [Caranx melampygus]|nr:hypothetical protein INR49_011708 [Caranx melampygus]